MNEIIHHPLFDEYEDATELKRFQFRHAARIRCGMRCNIVCKRSASIESNTDLFKQVELVKLRDELEWQSILRCEPQRILVVNPVKQL